MFSPSKKPAWRAPSTAPPPQSRFPGMIRSVNGKASRGAALVRYPLVRGAHFSAVIIACRDLVLQ